MGSSALRNECSYGNCSLANVSMCDLGNGSEESKNYSHTTWRLDEEH